MLLGLRKATIAPPADPGSGGVRRPSNSDAGVCGSARAELRRPSVPAHPRSSSLRTARMSGGQLTKQSFSFRSALSIAAPRRSRSVTSSKSRRTLVWCASACLHRRSSSSTHSETICPSSLRATADGESAISVIRSMLFLRPAFAAALCICMGCARSLRLLRPIDKLSRSR